MSELVKTFSFDLQRFTWDGKADTAIETASSFEYKAWSAMTKTEKDAAATLTAAPASGDALPLYWNTATDVITGTATVTASPSYSTYVNSTDNTKSLYYYSLERSNVSALTAGSGEITIGSTGQGGIIEAENAVISLSGGVATTIDLTAVTTGDVSVKSSSTATTAPKLSFADLVADTADSVALTGNGKKIDTVTIASDGGSVEYTNEGATNAALTVNGNEIKISGHDDSAAAFKYIHDATNGDVLDLSATDAAQNVTVLTVSSLGNVTNVIPVDSSNFAGGVKIGGKAYIATVGGSNWGTDLGYLKVSNGTVTGFVFGQDGDEITVAKGADALEFYDLTTGSATTPLNLGFTFESSKVGYTIAKDTSTNGGYAVTFKDAATIKVGGATLDFTLADATKTAGVTVGFDADGKLTGVTGLAAAGDKVVVTGAVAESATEGLPLGALGAGGYVAVKSGNFTYEFVTGPAAKLTLTEADETLYAGGAATQIALEAESGTLTYNDVPYKYVNGGNAYFSATTGAPDGFVFAAVDDAITLTSDAPTAFTLGYLASKTAPSATSIATAPTVADSAQYTITMTTQGTAANARFEISDLDAGSTVTVGTNNTFAFDDKAEGATVVVDGTPAAKGFNLTAGSVTLGSGIATALNTAGFTINDKAVQLTGTAAADGLVYNATDKSLAGLTAASAIVSTGDIEKIYVNGANKTNFVFGSGTNAETFSLVTATGDVDKGTASYFTVKDGKATGFVFGEVDDTATFAGKTLSSGTFKLSDATTGKAFTAPTIINNGVNPAAAPSTVAITKKNEKIDGTKTDFFEIGAGKKYSFTFDDAALEFTQAVDNTAKVAVDMEGNLLCVTGLSTKDAGVSVTDAKGAVYIGADYDNLNPIKITGGGYTYSITDTSGTVAITDLLANSNVVSVGDIEKLQTKANTDGTFTFGKEAFTIAGAKDDTADTDGTLFLWNASTSAATGLSSIGDKTSISGALNGLTFNGNTAGLSIGTGTYTVYGGGLSLYGLTTADNLTAAGGISSFLTTGSGNFKLFGGSMSIADDADGVTFKVADDKLTGIEKLKGSAIGGFSGAGLSVNSIGVIVDGDNLVEVVGDDTKVTAIKQLGVDDATTAINVSASGVSEFWADKNGQFTFNGSVSATFGISGNGTDATVFNLAQSAITGIDDGEILSGDFTKLFTVNNNALQVAGDSSISVVGGTQILGLTGGASVMKADGFTSATTDGLGTFTFVGGQSFTVSGTDKDGVIFQLKDGKVTGISGVDDGEIVTGDLNGVIINGKEPEIIVTGKDGKPNTNLTYQNGTLSGIVNGDTVEKADNVTTIIAGVSGTFKFAGGQSFMTSDANGIQFTVTPGTTKVTAITELDANAKLEGTIGGLSINGKTVNITNDKDFGVIGATEGINGIYKLSDGAIVTDAANATLASTDTFGTFTFAGGQSFVTAGDSTVDFTLDKSAVTAIEGLSAGSVLGSFSGIQVNGSPINVVDADNKVEVFADDKGALSKIDKVTGGASIGEIGSVSQILTDKAGEFVFTVGSQSFTTEGDNYVTFGMSASKVTSISDLSGSVTGSFSGITVNGATIDIKDADNLLTVVGNGKALDEIQGVDADATINAAGSAVDLVANIGASSGKFTFADSGVFTIAGDSSVTFELDATAAAKVTGINKVDGPATVTGGLSQVSVNGNSMSVAGDADNQFSYMIDAAGKATLGGVGGENVTVSKVGGASFVEVTTEGNYDFFGKAYGLSFASGESSVLFGTNGTQVTSVADLEGTLQGDFSATGFTVNGKEFEIAGDSSVGIVGSGSGVTKIVDLTGGATVKGVGGASIAVTDGEGKFTFNNGSFSVAGDTDGVTFMLDGDKVVGIQGLDEGATLTGSLDQLNSINGAKLDIKDDKDFGVVGAASGISKVIDLSTPANVVNAGGASQAAADTSDVFTFPNGTFTVSGDSAATFDLDAKTSEVTNINVVSGATVSGPLNGIAINGGASLNVVGDTVFGAVAGDGQLAQLVDISGGANVVGAGGASQFVTDSEGEFTILGTAMEISGDDSVMFTAGTSGITAIDSLEGTAIGDFGNVIAVNGENEVQILGDSSIEVTSDGTAVTAINAVTGSDAPTIAAVGGATEIGTDAAGTFTFTTGGDSKAFTVGEDDEVTFALEDGAVTGVNALEDGTLGFKDVNDLTVNETELTIESTQNVSLSIADSAVVYVKGVDGEISGLENATVAATTAMTVNGTDINVQGDEDYKVIVQDGAVVGLTDVSDGATVNVAGVSIAVDSSGDFQIGGNDYTFTDENNAFTLTTGDDSQLSGVDELEGNVVIAAPADQSLTVNDDELAFASGADSVTVAAGASGITAVNGLIDKDGVTVAAGASIAMLGSTASVSTEGAQLKVNEVTYTLLNDADGITVTGGREVTGLDENASLYVSEKGKYTVNGNGSDIEVEDTAMPIIGLDNATDAYIYDPANLIIRKGTPVSSIEQMLGLTTEYPEDPGFGTADDPLTSAEVEAVFGASSTVDLDKPIETFATNETKEPQDINLANTDFSKKVHLFDGPQSVEFNNFGGNEAIIERENPDGSATGGEKNVSLGNGGDAVIMKADAGNGSAANVTGGTGDDSIVVQGSAPVNFDMSAGGDDKIVTFASSGARVTLAGYNALTNPNAGIHITERWASIANAILTGLLSFGDGVLNINSASGDTAKIEFAGNTDPVGAVLVNLFDYLGRKQAVGFTNSGGGLADFSAAVEPMILIGNDGNKTGGSSLLGGSGDDTAFAGGGDEIDLGLGNNQIVLDPSTTREGAGIALTRGRTTISGFNGTFNLDHGDVIATDLSAANISFDGTNVYIEGDGFYGVIAGAKPDGAISYDEALTESADEAAPLGTKSGDYTNVLFNNAGVLVKTAIAKEGGVIDVKLDQDQRALNYIGDNSGLTFYDHTGEVLVNLADGTGSIDTADALFSGINSVAAGAGQTTLIGADDNETLIAGTGNDSIWGAGGNNLMRGNTNSGKTGQTSFFVVAEKDGARNTIESFNFVTDDNYTNTNKITADKLDIQIQYDQIQTENGGVAISGNDVVLLVNNRNENKAESVIIKDAVGKDFIVSGDGIIKDVIAQVNVDKLTADKFANYFVATGKNATLTVSDEFDKANIYLDNETPLGSDHEDEIPQFYGDFKVIDATGSNAKLELGGNDLDNTILAGTGDTSLWGGNGGNDLLVAGLGKNSFFYNYGNGNDTIRGAKEGDVIDLTNILLDDIVDADSAIGDDGVKLQFTDGNTLTVEGTAGEYLIGDDTYVVEDGKWSKKA